MIVRIDDLGSSLQTYAIFMKNIILFFTLQLNNNTITITITIAVSKVQSVKEA